MKKILSFLLLFAFAGSAVAQQNNFTPPQYKKIRKAIEKKGSGSYYPGLMQRLQTNDTTLTVQDYHLLYYGYALQPGYAPYATHPLADSLMSILRKEEVTGQDYEAIIRHGSALLLENPFEIRFLDPLIYAHRMKGNQEMAARLEFRFGRIIETIFGSGDGLTRKTAFHVISVSHEYDMLRALGFGFGGQQQLIDGKYDYLKVRKNDYGIEGMYFDVSVLLRSLSNLR